MKMFRLHWKMAFLAWGIVSSAIGQTTWTNAGASGMWTNATIWSGPAPGYPNGADSVVQFFSGPGMTSLRGVTNTVSITNGTILFNTPTNNSGFNLWTNSGSGQLYLDVTSGNALIVNATNAGSGANQIIIPIAMLDPLVVSNHGVLGFAGGIDNGGHSITFAGSGVTSISRPTTGAGQIELQSGVLNLSHTNAVGPMDGPAMIASGGGLAWGINAAGLIPKALVISNTVALVPHGGGSSSFGWQGGIHGPGQLVVSNPSSIAAGITLGSNSYSGGAILSNTTVSIQNAFAFGSGPVTLRDGVILRNYQSTSFVNAVVLQGNVSFSTISMVWTNSVWDMDGGARTLTIDHNNTYVLTLLGLTNGGDFRFTRTQLYAATLALLGPVSHTGITFADGTTIQLGGTGANSAELVHSTNVILNNGVFLLDNRGGAASRVRTDAEFVLTNAALQMIGPGTAGQIFTQQVGAIALNFGANSFTVTNRGAFLAGEIARASGATLNVLGTNAPAVYVGSPLAGATNGIVPWAVINDGAGGFAAGSGGALAPYAGYTNEFADDPTANVKLSGAGVTTLASSRAINALWISNSGAILDLDGNTLSLTGGGLAFGPGSTPWVSNGVVNFGAAEGVIYNPGAARISAGLAGSGGLTKSGSGQLFLLGTNSFIGETRVAQGSLILQGGAISNGSDLVVVQGAAFQILGGSADVNRLQANSNWIGAVPSLLISSGNLITRSNSTAYAISIGHNPAAPASWTLLGGSNYAGVTLGTNATLRVSGGGSTLVAITPSSGPIFGGLTNSVIVDGGATVAQDAPSGGNLNLEFESGIFRVEGSNSAFNPGVGKNWGFGGRDALLVISNGASMTTGRGYVGIRYTPSGPFVGGTNIEMIVDGASFTSSAAGVGFLRFGYGVGAVSNRLSVRNGSEFLVSAGGSSSTFFDFGAGATASQTRAEISGGSIVRVRHGAQSVLLGVGNTHAGGTGNAFLLSEGSTLALSGTGSNILQVVGAGNVFSNLSSILEIGGSGVIFITNAPGAIVFTNAVLSWHNRSDSAVSPILSGTTFTNIVWQGDAGFRLNSASNATGLLEYVFDSVAHTGAPTNFQRLLLTGSNALWRSARLGIASGGAMFVTNALDANVQGVTTNAGEIRVVNSTVTWRSNLVVSGIYVSDPSTNTFATNLTVTASGALQGSNGDLFVVWRDLALQSTNRSLFNLAHATLFFTNGTSATNHLFDLTGSAALDLGSNWMSATALATNFAIGVLQIDPGNSLRLAGAATNALYVGVLDLGGLGTNALGSVLDLDVKVYYDPNAAGNEYLAGLIYDFDGWDGALAPLLPIPEPSVSLIFGAGVALMLLRRAHRPPR